MPFRFFSLPHLRLLNSSFMKKTLRGDEVFTRVFPHKLKYQSLSSSTKLGLLAAAQSQLQQYSSRASRNASEGRSAKSLIEDEAELSDWVSELKSDSFMKSRLYRDSDGGDDDWRSGGKDSVSKRKRESDSDGYNNRGSFDRDSRGKGRSGGEIGIERSRGRGSGDSRGRGRFGGELERRNDRFSRDSNEGEGSRKSFDSMRKGKRLNDDRFVSKRGGKSMSRGSFMVSDEDDDDWRSGGKDSVSKRKRESDSYGYNNRGSFDRDSRGKGRSGGEIGIERGRGRSSGDSRGRGRFGGELERRNDRFSRDSNEGEGSRKSFDSMRKGKRLNDDSEDDEENIDEENIDDDDETYLSEARFDQCAVSPLSLKAIKDAGYDKMTVDQEATLPVILKGKDVLAKARSGTGKTVAFLLPSIEVVVKSPVVSHDQKRTPILVLVICPTRELASQAAMEANKLLKYHPSIGVQVVIGGTRLGLEQKRMQARPCQILVATPGRLKDHIENTAGFATRLMGVKVLVLDEADHLLDMGFRKDIEKIIAAVQKQRQTLLFSATVSPEVRQICNIALKRDHKYINTVREGSEETNTQVKQTHLVVPLDKQFSLLYALLKDHIADDPDYKVLVFCTTAKVTQLVADLLGELKLNAREIHSRKPQSYRTRISDEFRKSKGLILVTSDVSARGVDYPDVTLVLQVGLPADKAQYIHRLGRTGRKGKEGQGVLLLAPWEQFFLSTVKDLPISKGEPPLIDPDTKKKVEKALCHVEMKNKESAYQAWLGYYNSNKTIGKDKYRLVELANEFSRSMGLDNPPAIPKLVLGKMGLKNVPGLRSK